MNIYLHSDDVLMKNVEIKFIFLNNFAKNTTENIMKYNIVLSLL